MLALEEIMEIIEDILKQRTIVLNHKDQCIQNIIAFVLLIHNNFFYNLVILILFDWLNLVNLNGLCGNQFSNIEAVVSFDNKFV